MSQMRNRLNISHFIFGLLALATVITLLTNFPSLNSLSIYAFPLLIYSVLTLFTLYLGVLLSESRLSAAHIAGILGILSLPSDAQDAVLWTIAVSAFLGATLLLPRYVFDSGVRLTMREMVMRAGMLVARLTLSTFVAAQFYRFVGGRVPLISLNNYDIVPLLGFAALYIGLYFLIYLLQLYLEQRSIKRVMRRHIIEIVSVIVLPVPFAVLGAEVYNRLSPISFFILIFGILLTVFAQFVLSRTRYWFERQVDELQSLSLTSQALSANLNLDALLSFLYTQVARILDTDHFIVALYNPDGHTLSYPFVVQEGKRNPMPDGDILLRHVLNTQEPLLLQRDITEDVVALGLTPMPPNTTSWLGVPLQVGSRILGALVVISVNDKRIFNVEDKRLLTTIAANDSVAIENAQLYQTQTTRVHQLATLNQILSLLTETLSEDSVLDTVISSASALADATAVAVYLEDDKHNHQLLLKRYAGLSEGFAEGAMTPIHTQRTGQSHKNGATNRTAWSSATPLLISDIESDLHDAEWKRILREENKHAVIELPLMVSGTLIGMLALYFDSPTAFNDVDIQLLLAFANQVAQAIRNANLYTSADSTLERSAAQLVTLASIGHALTATLNREFICDLVLSYALDTTDSHIGVLALYEQERLMIVSQKGITDDDTAVLPAELGDIAFDTDKSVVYDNIQNPFHPESLSRLITPMKRSGETFGVIVLESADAKAFSDVDTHFIMQLANQAIIALDNTALFERIEEARDRLQVILDAIGEGIILIDLQGVVTLANPRIDLIGLDAEFLAGQRLDALLSNYALGFVERTGFSTPDEILALLDEGRANRWTTHEPVAYALAAEEGDLFIQRQHIPIYDTNNKIIGVLLVFYDLTEEHQLKQAREDLSRMIIHDLRSPLTAVTTSLKLLNEIIPKDAVFRPVVEKTTDASHRAIRKLLSRVDSLLDVAKMESGQLELKIEAISIQQIIDNAYLELSPIAKELNVSVDVEIAYDLPLLNVDADKIEHVMLNLVDNALKFSPKDGNVRVIAQRYDAGYMRVDVVDQGPGVPDDYKQLLFERFVQVSGRTGARRGVGLGLTFCRLVIEAHNGRIWVEDDTEGGSRFVFTLPLLEDASLRAGFVPVSLKKADRS